MSLPPREAWIEISGSSRYQGHAPSLPPREAWIEILINGTGAGQGKGVASPAGSVD